MKRFTLALVALASLVSVANAQVVIRDKSLIFQRIDAAATPIGYSTPFSDGNHPAAGKGIAVAPQDTAIVDIQDHYYRGPRVNLPFPGSGAASDSLWLGTLTIEGSSSTIDTVKFFRDVSPDGSNWTLVDSAVTHITSGQVATAIHASAVDSVRAILATTGDPLATGKRAVVTLYAHPGMTVGGITAQALKDVNFIRFRIAMSPGDFAAAGTSNGLRASFRYPAVSGSTSQ